MPEKLSIEVVKHSNNDIRVIIKSDYRTSRASLDDLYLSKSLVYDAIESSIIFTESTSFVQTKEDE